MNHVTVDQLARKIHAVWREAKERDGWRLGVANASNKTSPYLKPLSAFTPLEWRRERWLALADLLTITNSPQYDLSTLSISGGTLRALNCDEAMAARVHHAWRAINRHLGADDERTYLDFASLSPSAQTGCLANIACDIKAIIALNLSGDAITISACDDLHADAALLSQIFAPATADALPQTRDPYRFGVKCR